MIWIVRGWAGMAGIINQRPDPDNVTPITPITGLKHRMNFLREKKRKKITVAY